jgi:CRP-like cAMP-binding protein
MHAPLSGQASSPRNRLLAALAPQDWALLQPQLTHVSLVQDQVLYEAGAPIEDVFFIEAGLISRTADTADTNGVEVGLIGREGMLGAPVLLSPEPVAFHKAMVQIPGTALRIGAVALRQAFTQSPALHERCLRYVHFLLTQTMQLAACNARHEMAVRLARWLLMAHDRMEGDVLPLRQDFLAQMLGVRRAGVNEFVGLLEHKGLIRHARGHIHLLDRAGLEAAACNCYRLLRQCQAQILGDTG